MISIYTKEAYKVYIASLPNHVMQMAMVYLTESILLSAPDKELQTNFFSNERQTWIFPSLSFYIKTYAKGY